MWLPRFTRLTRQAFGLPLAGVVLVIAGCAASGTKPAPEEFGTSPAATIPEVPVQALTLFEQAVAVMAAGDFVDAELRFKEFLLQYPDYPGAHVNLAIIYTENGDSEAALQALGGALALNPEYPPALNQQGLLLRRNGKFLEAEAAYMKAVTASPDYALAHYNLGVLNELYLQRLDVALQHFEAYQTLVGDDKQVEKWIADLRRRVAASQSTANVTE